MIAHDFINAPDEASREVFAPLISQSLTTEDAEFFLASFEDKSIAFYDTTTSIMLAHSSPEELAEFLKNINYIKAWVVVMQSPFFKQVH
jgi:hypothetical protein